VRLFIASVFVAGVVVGAVAVVGWSIATEVERLEG
jgi:hypothetical protein